MKTIAYYLPQFHSIPENDKAWGKGYTEWVAVKEAKPLYEGHKQPVKPYNEYYYKLLDKKAMEWQSKLMKEYEIDGLCFYHYWFGNEKQALNAPAENLLQWEDINMPFCFCWANQSWLYRWSRIKGMPWVSKENKHDDGANNVIFKQIYGRRDEWKRHFDYLFPFFCDKRYIKYDDKPLFVILSVDDVPCLNEMMQFWNDLAIQKGLKGIYVIGCDPRYYKNYAVDAYMYHEPAHTFQQLSPDVSLGIKRYSYEDATKLILEEKYPKDKIFFGSTFCSFDNTPRYGNSSNAKIFYDASPELFKENLSITMAKCFIRGIDLCFIDAWNEWAEGMHLEPDEEYENGWLNAVKDAKKTFKKKADELIDNNYYIDSNEYELRYKASKSQCMVDALDRWIEKKESCGSVVDYLKRDDVKTILIYGYSIIAKHFIYECKKQGINVNGVIDRRDDIVEMETIQINENLPAADAIVITSPFYTDEIFKTIRSNHINIPIYTINELLEE